MHNHLDELIKQCAELTAERDELRSELKIAHSDVAVLWDSFSKFTAAQTKQYEANNEIKAMVQYMDNLLPTDEFAIRMKKRLEEYKKYK